jgi:hypothetical protein
MVVATEVARNVDRISFFAQRDNSQFNGTPEKPILASD